MHTVIDHPLVRDRVTRLRDRETPPKVFREVLRELSGFIAYEALRDAKTERLPVVTPVDTAEGETLCGKVVLVPVLRAGINMLDAVLDLLPTAVVGLLGVHRGESEGRADAGYSKVPVANGDERAIMLDPMIATGGKACEAVARLKAFGYRDIRFLSVIAAKPGVEKFEAAHPDVPIYLAALDEKLDERLYIRPGLGDIGDRLCGTRGNSALNKLLKQMESHVLADGRVDIAEAGELLRLAEPLTWIGEDIAAFKKVLDEVCADGKVDSMESRRVAQIMSSLADKANAGQAYICPKCRRPISSRLVIDGVVECPWCEQVIRY